MIRNNALIYGLNKNGHEIDLLSIEISSKNPYYDETIEWSKEINIIELKENKKIEQYLSYSDTKQNKVKSILKPFIRKGFHALSVFDNTISYTKNINSKSIEKILLVEYDLIISSSDPKSSHVMVKKLIDKGLKFGKWIQYWGDPLTIDITRKSLYPMFISRFFEKNIFSDTDKIFYVSPFTLKSQKKSIPKFGAKMDFLPVPYKKEKKYKGKINTNTNSLKLGYFGDYNSKIRNIIPLYNSIANNPAKNSLFIAGNSDLKLKSTERIEVLPRVKSRIIAEKEDEVDVLVCILNKNGTQIPGKLYHYAASNKPVLVILDGEGQTSMKDYLESFNRFILCKNDENSILLELIKIKETNHEYTPSPYLNSTVIAKLLIDKTFNYLEEK